MNVEYFRHEDKVPASEPLELDSRKRCHQREKGEGYVCFRSQGHAGPHVAHWWNRDMHHPFMAARWSDGPDTRVLL